MWMPNRKTDTNNNHAFSTDYIGGNYDYPDADYATREKIVADHRSYQQGLLWTLANHPRVPQKVRDEFQRLGLAKDEFVDNDNWPTQLYVREARRMIGAVRDDRAQLPRQAKSPRIPSAWAPTAWTATTASDTSRPTATCRTKATCKCTASSRTRSATASIIPKADECDNLLVPVCLSSSHIAYGSIRMEPVFMILGQSAATAAALAIDDDIAVQKVDYQRLRERLLADRQVLESAAKYA